MGYILERFRKLREQTKGAPEKPEQKPKQTNKSRAPEKPKQKAKRRNSGRGSK
ncbi:hypothetical protein [Thermovibrio ammonificans]